MCVRVCVCVAYSHRWCQDFPPKDSQSPPTSPLEKSLIDYFRHYKMPAQVLSFMHALHVHCKGQPWAWLCLWGWLCTRLCVCLRLCVAGLGGAGVTHNFDMCVCVCACVCVCRQMEEQVFSMVRNHDLSSARAALVASVPGTHHSNSLNKYGHMRVKQLLSKVNTTHTHTRTHALACAHSLPFALVPPHARTQMARSCSGQFCLVCSSVCVCVCVCVYACVCV